jgi:hypothetical protein
VWRLVLPKRQLSQRRVLFEWEVDLPLGSECRVLRAQRTVLHDERESLLLSTRGVVLSG